MSGVGLILSKIRLMNKREKFSKAMRSWIMTVKFGSGTNVYVIE